MINFVLIAVCLLSGFLVREFKALPHDSYKSVNAWVINVALPAVALKYIPLIQWNFSLILPFLMPLMVWAGAYIFVKILSRRITIDSGTRAALFLTAGLGNTSFLGFPLSEAYFGTEGLQIAILCDQACFLVMATLGIITATRAANEGKSDIGKILKKIMLFPPFLAFCLALILPHFISFDPFSGLLESLALTLVPLALFSVGLQLKLKINGETPLIAAALSYKLLLAPLLILLLCLFTGFTGFIAKISIFESAMAPMVTGVIIATEYDLNPKLANIILGVGIPVSLATTFLWAVVLQFL